MNCASGRFRSSSLRSTRPTLTAVIFSLLPTAPPTPTAFHQDFIRGRVTLIGCPKLDEGDYSEKLTAILA